MYDARLIGKWKSDKRRTMQDVAARRDISARSRSVLKRILGKLELRYTRTHVHSTFEELSDVERYEVVAKNDSSVVTVSVHPLYGKRIQHKHFDGQYYWVSLGRYREYFKHIGKTKRRIEL